jgi:hypothetical protein
MTLLNFFEFLKLNFNLSISVSIKENKSESSFSHFFYKVIINQDLLPDRGRELEEFERNPDALKEIFKDLLEYEVIQYEIRSYCDVMESIFNPGKTYIRSRTWALWVRVRKINN